MTPRSRLSRAQQRGDLELVAEIERRRRLVEQEHLGRLRQRAGNDDALFFTAAERHVGASGEVVGAGGGERISRQREVARSFELERTKMRMAAHQHHFHHRVVEGRVRFLRHNGQCRAMSRRERPASEMPFSDTWPCAGCSTPLKSFSSVVLPQPFGPSSPVSDPRSTVTLTSSSVNDRV